VIERHVSAEPLIVRRYERSHAWIPDQVPSDEARVAAVIRIAEGALDGVCSHERKERRGSREALHVPRFDVGQDVVLLVRRQILERLPPGRLRDLLDGCETGGVEWSRRGKRAAERPVDVTSRSRLLRPGSACVARNEPRDDRFEHVLLHCRQMLQRFARGHGLPGRQKNRSIARDRLRNHMRRDNRRRGDEACPLQQLPARNQVGHELLLLVEEIEYLDA
jgi:hypothetical protein